MKILVAEDDSQLARLYKIFLYDLGHNVFISQDGEECLDTYNKAAKTNAPFDLVILDYRMPKKNGMEVAKEIATTNSSQRLLMITAFAGLLDLSEAPVNLKIIEKPFDMDELELTINGIQ